MLLRSKTFLLSSIEDQQLSCVISMQHYPYIHLIVILFVQFILINIYFFLLLICFLLILLSPRFRNYRRLITETIQLQFNEQDERDAPGIILLEKELILTFVYVLFAFSYKWFGLMNNDEHITSMNFYRWLIEASTIPYVLLRIFSNYCMGYIDSFFDECKSIQVCAIMLKVPLFFLMRYAENQPDCFLKDMEGWIFYALCKSSSK